MARNIRRIVTAVNNSGQSFVLSDGEPDITLEIPGVVKMRDLWRTDAGATVPVMSQPDLSDPSLNIAPGSTKFSIAQIQPTSQSEDAATPDEIFGAMDSEDVMVEGRHPTMHATDSVDYAVVLEGELWLILDEEEVLVKAGDLVVQGGVTHTWENRTDGICLLLAVLVGAERA